MILDFLLGIHPTILILVIGIILSVIMVFVYKFMTDQNLMKQLRDEIKELQNDMKELRNNPTQMAEVNKRAMETNMKYMMHSMKPTLVTFIPMILIFGWLNGHVAYDPLVVGNEFHVDLDFENTAVGNIVPTVSENMIIIDGKNKSSSYTIKEHSVRIVFKGEAPGTYTLYYTLENETGNVQKTWENNVTITDSESERKYLGPIFKISDKTLKTITVSNERFHPFGSFHIFSWYPGWVALYIITSLVCSLGLRKWLKIY